MFRMIKRTTATALRLPGSLLWDFVSLGNMGEGTSTGRLLREQEKKKQLDDLSDEIEVLNKILDMDRKL